MNEVRQISTPPPIICANDRVLLAYAILDEAVRFNEGHGLLFLGKKEIGPVPCLAISADRKSNNVTLYFCHSDWRPHGIAVVESVAKAKNKAERIYPGSSRCWVEPHLSDEDVADYIDES